MKLRARLQKCSLLLSAALALAACSDPTDPCDARGACIVEGADLVVEEPNLIAWPKMRIDSVSGYPVVATGDTLVVELVVRNRGNERSVEDDIFVCFDRYASCFQETPTLTLPPLQPGQLFADTIRVVVPREFWYFETDRLTVELNGVPEEFSYANNVADITVYLGHARINAVFDPPAQIRVGQTVALPITFINESRFEAVPADTAYVCIGEYDLGSCPTDFPGYPVFARVALPVIPPGGSFSHTFDFTVPVAAIGPSIELPYKNRRFDICIGRNVENNLRAITGCDSERLTDVLPDLDLACAALGISADTIVVGQTQQDLCDLRIGSNAQVWSFDAEKGESFSARLLDPDASDAILEVVNHDGDWRHETGTHTLFFTVPASGRYHLAIADAGAYRLSLMRE